MQLESFLGYTSIEIITNDDKSASMIENLSPTNQAQKLFVLLSSRSLNF